MKRIDVSKLSPEIQELLKKQGVLPEEDTDITSNANDRVAMVKEMQDKGEDIRKYHFEAMEDRKVKEIYLLWKKRMEEKLS